MHRERFHLNENVEHAMKLFSRVPRIARRHLKSVEWLKDAYHKVDDRLDSLLVRVGYPTIAQSDELVSETLRFEFRQKSFLVFINVSMYYY